MKYYKRLRTELSYLAEKLGKTVTSEFQYDHGRKSTRARALQSMVQLIRFVMAMDAELDEWCPDNTEDWAKYLKRLEKWLLSRPIPSDTEPSLPTYQEMLMRLCTELDLKGQNTFDQVMVYLVKEQKKFGKIKLLMLTNDGTAADRQAKIHDILWS